MTLHERYKKGEITLQQYVEASSLNRWTPSRLGDAPLLRNKKQSAQRGSRSNGTSNAQRLPPASYRTHWLRRSRGNTGVRTSRRCAEARDRKARRPHDPLEELSFDTWLGEFRKEHPFVFAKNLANGSSDRQ